MRSAPLTRATASASVLLGLLLLWLVHPSIAVIVDPDRYYFLSSYAQHVGLLVGWSAVACALVSSALRRGLLRTPGLPAVALAAFAVSVGAVARMTYANGPAHPGAGIYASDVVKDGHVVLFDTSDDVRRLVVLLLAGLLLPGLLGGIAIRRPSA